MYVALLRVVVILPQPDFLYVASCINPSRHAITREPTSPARILYSMLVPIRIPIHTRSARAAYPELCADDPLLNQRLVVQLE
jgi:hypothetical protein